MRPFGSTAKPKAAVDFAEAKLSGGETLQLDRRLLDRERISFEFQPLGFAVIKKAGCEA